ncbi:MAG: A24 family peptidase [Maricaulaceae bacterium]
MSQFILIFFCLALCGFLGALSYIDLKHFRLPNVLTATLIVIGLGQTYILGLPFSHHVIGAALGYFSFVAIEQGFLKLRGYPGLGRGDAKLLAASGAWVGWMGLPYIVLLASLAGLSVMFTGLLSGRIKTQNMNKLAIPFGPFLSLATALTWFALIFWPHWTL